MRIARGENAGRTLAEFNIVRSLFSLGRWNGEALEGRRILIYPEGHLARPGEHFRYRTGVYYMARDFGMPVVPAASNLALFWPQEAWTKTPGTAVLEFLAPIPPGLDKDDFMARLEAAVETRTAELIAEARGGPVVPSVLGAPDDERQQTAPATAATA